MLVSERIAQAARQIALDDQHGYSQPNREGWGSHTISFSDGSTYTIKGGDLDCSEMVRRCVNAALGREAIGFMWTGDEDEKLRSLGFRRIAFDPDLVCRGDVLWVHGHTGIALGNGLQADAHGDEIGGLKGPTGGDNTGHEVEVRSLKWWTFIYRYEGSDDEEAFVVQAKVKFPDGVNIRERPTTKSKVVGSYPKGGTCNIDGVILADGIPWGTYVGNSGNRRYVALGHLDIAEVIA